ncbi:MAG: 3'-5' exonuclease [Acidimicrobiia bacterium]|nr:3'-5' exonuclease [Acidimicrobiia bacterium]
MTCSPRFGHARTSAAQEEERRLLYVALTRACQHLSITWARERSFGARTVQRRPSPYLLDVERALGSAPRGTHRDRARPAPEPSGHGSGAPRTGDDDPEPTAERRALEALRTWRTATGWPGQADVPAAVVFGDDILRDPLPTPPDHHRRGPRRSPGSAP